jgi:hypothetical protein
MMANRSLRTHSLLSEHVDTAISPLFRLAQRGDFDVNTAGSTDHASTMDTVQGGIRRYEPDLHDGS